MRQTILLLCSVIIIAFLSSCRKDFSTTPSTGQLEFSRDTVYLDTVFTNIGSSTYTLKVYNRTNQDITIPSITLEKGENSKYRLMVDGMTGQDGSDSDNYGDGKIFKNINLLAKDSLYIFIETTASTIDANPNNFLYTDKILFDGGSLQQDVDLVTLIKDAIFLYPQRFGNANTGYSYEGIQLGQDPDNLIYGFQLNPNDPINGNELHFTKDKPYVIYGYAEVPVSKTLLIDPGARVHFHDQSGIIVKGTLQVNGLPSPIPQDPNAINLLPNEVIFEGDRLEPRFADVPGQWGTILLYDNSTNHSINHLTIKNAAVGLFILNNDGTSVQIKNTQIYNSSNAGILARTGKINAENLVINNAGQYAISCTLGGNYNFTHCTFANYWQSGSRQTPAVLLDNTFTMDRNTVVAADLVQANFNNCIIYGSNNVELGLNKSDAKAFNYQFKNCLLKFNDTNNQFGNNPLYLNILNEASNLIHNNQNNFDPKFKNSARNNFRIKSDSPAIGKGNPLFIITKDADGIVRTTPPDLGAYEHLP